MPSTVIDMPLDGPAIARFPEMRREAQNGGLRFIMLPPGKTALRWVTEASFIDVNLTPGEHEIAWNADRVQRRTFPPDSISFVPHGGEFRLRAQNVLPGLIVEVEPDYWSNSMREAFDLEGLDFLYYKHDPVAAELGRAGIAALMEDHRSGEATDALLLESIGLGLIARLARRLEDDGSIARAAPTPSALARQRLARVTEWVEAHLGESVSVADMAGVAGMSVSHFARSFKLAMDVGPARYVVIRRVARANQLLAHSDLSIAEIAYACGFSGQAHLTRTFKDMTGITPGAFRRGVG